MTMNKVNHVLLRNNDTFIPRVFYHIANSIRGTS